MNPATNTSTIALPYDFDTSNVWHLILKGAFGLNAFLIASVIFTAFARPLPVTIGLVICELFAFAFTRLCIRYQEGSIGTLTRDQVELRPNAVLGISLPGPGGSFAIDRFSAVRVEFRPGPIRPDVQGGPNEVIWLVGREGTPNVAIARTDGGAGGAAGRRFGELLGLPVEEVGAPRIIQL